VTPSEVRDPKDVSSLAAAVYRNSFSTRPQVSHIAAVWRDGAGGHRFLRLTDETPTSSHDQFVLGLSRARADAILATGQILRSEPELTHEFLGPPGLRTALAAWRREVAGKTRPVVSVILTSGRTLPRHHPLFREPSTCIIFTSREGEARLAAWAVEANVQVVSVVQPSAAAAIKYLRETVGAATIAVEAGARTTLPLYQPPSVVDELLLSTYLGRTVAARVRGSAFLDPATLDRLFPWHSTPYEVGEPSGPWRFERFAKAHP